MTGRSHHLVLTALATLTVLLFLFGAYVGGGIQTYGGEEAYRANFVVDEIGDLPDFEPGDGICRICLSEGDEGGCDLYGGCTLRAAIEEANTTTGADAITFAIGQVTPITPLPEITSPVTIDGGGSFVLDGGAVQGLGASNPALKFHAAGNELRGIEIRQWLGTGAQFLAGGNLVEEVFIHDNGLDGIGDGLDFRSGSDNQILSSSIIGNGHDIAGGLSLGRGILLVNVQNTVVQGNRILHNAADGLLAGNVFGDGPPGVISDLTIGGATGTPGSSPGNLISGNGGGIEILQTSGTGTTTIRGNIIGPDETGSAPLINPTTGKAQNTGIDLDGSTSEMFFVGGAASGERNIISGHRGAGVVADDNTQIVGNLIGTDVTGQSAVPNETGIRLTGNQALVQDNVVSGNTEDGIGLGAGSGDGNVIENNLIGVAADGSTPLGNGRAGIGIFYVPDNTELRDNLIAGNGLHGIWLFGSENLGRPAGTVIQGNHIGIARDNITAIANGGSGIRIDDADVTTIGGLEEGEVNVIAYNEEAGIRIPAGMSNEISGNRLFDNFELGIDLHGQGVTYNDVHDDDGGANNRQNYPVLTYKTDAGQTVVTGSLRSEPNTSYRLEFFASNLSEDDPPEGETYLGITDVSTDENGIATFELIFGGEHDDVTATATDPAGNTSEFSPGAADVYVDKTVTPTTDLEAGDEITYRIRVDNNGPNTAGLVRVFDIVPTAVQIEDVRAFPGPQAASADCEATGQLVTCTITLLEYPPGEPVLIEIDGRIVNGGTIENSADVDLVQPGDPNPENDRFGPVTIEIPEADLHFSLRNSDRPGSSGQIPLEGRVWTFWADILNTGPDAVGSAEIRVELPNALLDIEAIDPESHDHPTTCSSELMDEKEVLTCTVLDLPPSAEQTVRATLRIAEDTAGQTLVAEGFARATGGTSDPDETNDTFILTENIETPTSGIEITKTAVNDNPVVNLPFDPSDLPEGAQYEITVTSTEDVQVTMIDEWKSDEMSFVDVTEDGCTVEELFPDSDQATTQLICELTLEAHTPREMLVLTLPLIGGEIRNVAQVGNVRATETVEAQALEVDIRMAGDEPVLGVEFSYVMDVTNTGTQPAPGVVLFNSPPFIGGANVGPDPGAFRHISNDSDCFSDKGPGAVELTCPLGTLAPGETASVTTTGIVTAVAESFFTNITVLGVATSEDGRHNEDRKLLDPKRPTVDVNASNLILGESGGKRFRAGSIDVYVDSVLIADDLSSGVVSEYSSLEPGRTTVPVQIVDSASPDNSTPLLATTVDLLRTQTGLLEPSHSFLVTGPGETPGLILNRGSRAMAEDPARVDVFAVSDVTDATMSEQPEDPTHDDSTAIDVRLLEETGSEVVLVLSDSLATGDVSKYVSVDPAAYLIEITHSESGRILDSFAFDVSDAAGDALGVVAVGRIGGEPGLSVISIDGSASPLAVGSENDPAAGPENGMPAETNLLAGYPNPFRQHVTFEYTVHRSARVRVDVYDVIGRRIQTLVDQPLETGRHTLIWNGTDSSGRQLTNGLYFVQLTADGIRRTRAVNLVR